METFVQLVVNGLGKGAVYALLALGFVMIFKATEVGNFAHGSLVLVGGYLVWVLSDAIGWFPAAVAGIVGAALAALLVERLLSLARRADPDSLALLTIGVDVIITEEIVRRVGVAIPFIGEPYDAQPLRIGDITIFRTQAIALVVIINVHNDIILIAACAVFGFSVGNLITLPALIVQREFDPRSFGVLISLITAINQITYAFGPGVIMIRGRR